MVEEKSVELTEKTDIVTTSLGSRRKKKSVCIITTLKLGSYVKLETVAQLLKWGVDCFQNPCARRYALED